MLFGTNSLNYIIKGLQPIIEPGDRFGQFSKIEDSFFEHPHDRCNRKAADKDEPGEETEDGYHVKGLIPQIDGLASKGEGIMGHPAQVLCGCDQGHAHHSHSGKTISGTTRQKDRRKGDMKNKKEDERACHATGKMDEEKHGPIVE